MNMSDMSNSNTIAFLGEGGLRVSQQEKLEQTLGELAELVFPGRVRASYVCGSVATGECVMGSDFDLFVVFKEEASEGDRASLARMGELLSPMFGREIDTRAVGEDDLFRGTNTSVVLKLSGRLLRGEDVVPRIHLPGIEDYVNDRFQDSVCLVAFGLRPQRQRATDVLEIPLMHPDENGEFFGYDRRTKKSMRDLVTTLGWGVTTLVAQRTSSHVSTKAEAFRSYATVIGGPWAPLLQELVGRCRDEWAYEVPPDRASRVVLRRICRDVLGFENHLLEMYKAHLLEMLDEDKRSKVDGARLLRLALEHMRR